MDVFSLPEEEKEAMLQERVIFKNKVVPVV